MRKVFVVLALLAALSCHAVPSHAAVITGSSSGIFTNPVLQEFGYVTGVGTSTFTWGIPADDLYPYPSAMNFAGTSFYTATGSAFSFGVLSYYNGTIYSDTGADGVDLNVGVSLTVPQGVSQTFTFPLTLINTLNTDSPTESADYVVFPTAFPSTSFLIDGSPYTLAFLGFGDITGGGFAVQNEFHILEGESASAMLVGQVVPSPVPEPGTCLLLGSGLVGLAGLRKRARG